MKNGENSFELFSKLTDNSSEIECLFVERMKQLLKVGGYAGIVLPSSILNNSGIYTATREIILKYFKIIAITELGSNTFMATGTNTVIMFLERRSNNDHIHIQNAINKFFENAKDVTVLGIEKAFSKYVTAVFEDITFDDYVSFVNRKPSSEFYNLEIYNDYKVWFENLTEIKNLKKSKAFAELNAEEQQHKLESLFFEKVHEIEKDKILYFLLTYTQKTVITKVGEKQAEKEFLGYEFSNRRGHEGIKMLPSGTKLYDEEYPLNPEKANSYIYNAFLKKDLFVNEYLENNIFSLDSVQLMDFSTSLFDKKIEIGTRKQAPIISNWHSEKLKNLVYAKGGDSFPKEYQGNTNTENIPFLKVSDMNEAINGKYVFNTNNYVNEDTIGVIKSTVFDKNSIIFPKVGMAIFTEKKRILSRAMCVDNNVMALSIINNDVLHYEFLYELFDKYIKLKNFSSTANPPSIQTDKLLEYKIPVPPMEIQQKIVKEFEYIEEIEKNQTEKLNILKNSIIQENYFAYTDERIEKIAVMIQRGKSAKYGTSNIQIIKSGQARGYSDFDFSQKYYVAESFVSDERNLQKGDILINSTGVGTAGRVTLFDLDGDFVVDSHITIVRIDNLKATPKYIMYALANIGFKNIEAMANGQSGQIELALPTIKSIRVPLPPLEKQKEIVAEIETIEMEIKNIQDEIKQLSEQKKAILEKYL